MSTNQNNWHQEIHCDSAADFIENLRPVHSRWSCGQIDDEWLFRGISCDKSPLIPSAWRRSEEGPIAKLRQDIMARQSFEHLLYPWRDPDKPPFGLEPDLRDRWKKQPDDVKTERVRNAVGQAALELQLLHDFRLIANKVGHFVDSPVWIELDSSLSTLLPRTFGGSSEALFEDLLTATAQHHGVPTRLLDWTTHSLTAAYFAAQRPRCDRVAVWAVQRAVVKRTRLREVKVAGHRLRFLHAQEGCFVWDPCAIEDFAFTGEWPSQLQVIRKYHDDHGSVNPPRPWVYKLTLPSAEANQVMSMLWQERVSRAHLMPTLDNVTHALLGSVGWRDPESFLD